HTRRALRLRYVGDSYDIVKFSLLRWLSPLGRWSVHPMFTEAVSESDASAFASLMGVPLLSTRILERRTDRNAYFEEARPCDCHLFLDPDTGVHFGAVRSGRAPSYVFGSELIEVARCRPGRLTLVFDQCLARGREREGLTEKLASFASSGIHGVAYRSHA